MNSDTIYLHGSKLTEKIKELLSEGGLAIVAYVGAHASKVLNKNVRIICEFDSLGTNPHEIDRLKKLNYDVRKLEKLHAKVYLSDKGAIVGSANLSTNGLEIFQEVPSGLIEAAIFVSPSSQSYIEIKAWCEAQFKSSKDITNDEIQERIRTWDQKQRQSSSKKQSPSKIEITLEEVLNNPNDYIFSFITYSSEIKQSTEILESDEQEPITLQTFMDSVYADDFTESMELFTHQNDPRLNEFIQYLLGERPLVLSMFVKNSNYVIRENARINMSITKSIIPHKKREALLFLNDSREAEKRYKLHPEFKKSLTDIFAKMSSLQEWEQWADGEVEKEWCGIDLFMTGRAFKKMYQKIAQTK